MKYVFIFITACSLVVSLALAPALAADPAGLSAGPPSQEAGLKQDGTIDAPTELNKAYLKSYITDFENIVTSPARWDASDWIITALVSGAAVALYDNDTKIQKWALDHKTTTTDDIGDNVTDFGHGKYTPVILGGMYLYGHFADDKKMRKTVLLSLESFIVTGAFVQTLKYSTHRHRPYTNDPPHTWDGPSLKNEGADLSFASGHASSAFAVATVIAEEYDNAFVPPLAYGIAAITAMNRVTHNAHWSSDVFVGSAVGYFTGRAIVAYHRGGGEQRVSIAPMLDGNYQGLMVTCKF